MKYQTIWVEYFLYERHDLSCRHSHSDYFFSCSKMTWLMLFSQVKILHVCFPVKLTWYFIGGYSDYKKLMVLFNQNQINDLFVFAIIKASLKHPIHNGFKPRINGDILIWFLYFKDSLFSVRINALGCENTKMIHYQNNGQNNYFEVNSFKQRNWTKNKTIFTFLSLCYTYN